MCGVSDARALLFDVVLLDGIDKVCRKCSFEEDSPIIKKPNFQEVVEKPLSVRERLSKLSNFESRGESEIHSFSSEKFEKENEELKREETKLNEIVNRNFRRTVGTTDLRNELIDNFHWIVMRARRSKHLMQKEMADKIKESEVSLRMFEKGVVNDMNLVKKIENFLSIRLRKEAEKPVEEVEYPKFETEEEIDNFDGDKFKGLTIEDLKRMREEKESDWAYARGDTPSHNPEERGRTPKKGEEFNELDDTPPSFNPEEKIKSSDSGDFELLDDFEGDKKPL